MALPLERFFKNATPAEGLFCPSRPQARFTPSRSSSPLPVLSMMSKITRNSSTMPWVTMIWVKNGAFRRGLPWWSRYIRLIYGYVYIYMCIYIYAIGIRGRYKDGKPLIMLLAIIFHIKPPIKPPAVPHEWDVSLMCYTRIMVFMGFALINGNFRILKWRYCTM